MSDGPAPQAVSVVLRSGALALAVPLGDVRRVMPARGFTSVPLARPEVIGVMVLEGKAVPVYRLESLEPGSPPGGPMAPGRIGSVAILEREGALAGFLVEGSETVRGEVGEGIRRSDAREILAAVGALASGGQEAAQTAHGDRGR
jgi:chemotaxis signal transduction protein